MFLAVKIVPLSVAGEVCVALTIYYKNPKYAPIVVMTTLIKAEQFVLSPEPFKFYMNSEWFIGWGFNKTSLFNLVSFAPVPYQQVVKDSFKIYRTIAKILKLQEQFKNNFNKDKLLNTLEDSAVASLLGGGVAFQTYKQLRTKQDLNKTIKTLNYTCKCKYNLANIYKSAIVAFSHWWDRSDDYFKSVYLWNNDSEPNTPFISPKIEQIIDWNLKNQNNINNDDNEIKVTVKNKDISENHIYQLEANYFN
ncbi:hypothetical protein [Spiroplasma endosymbiont of Polydrusus formosus]|uniref:hypothetical protein n=1 Tax=Spiroplasma endosymbiont of Polydrusus formosus TaxID=3139326 RepID=UPI0035B55F36